MNHLKLSKGSSFSYAPFLVVGQSLGTMWNVEGGVGGVEIGKKGT